MAFDANRADLTIGVLGSGAMGRGIVQVAAAGGINVLMMDAKPGAAAEAREFIGKMLMRAAEKGQHEQGRRRRRAGPRQGRQHAG